MLGTADLMMTALGYRYWRISALTSNTTWVIDELRYISAGVGYPNVSMTSNNTPAPLVASASTYYSAFDPYKAFDNVSGQRWLNDSTSNIWLQIDLGASGMIDATAVSIMCGDAQTAPTNFAITASNDAATWVTKLTVGSVPWNASETRIFQFTA